MKKKVIILGASRYNSKSILAAKQAGYYVIALDRNPQSEGFDHADLGLTCDIIDKQAVLQVAEKHRIDGIIPINDYGVPTAAYVAKNLGLPGINEQSAVWATNKEEMRRKWIKSGIPCPRVAVATTPEDFLRATEEVGFPCIFKPAHGIGGASRGVVVVHDKSEIEKARTFSQQFYPDKTTLVESFVQSQYEHSAEVIVDNGEPHVIAISDKIKSPLPYRVDKNVLYPTLVQGQALERLKQAIQDATRAVDIKVGAAHVEMATTVDGIVFFEIGARCGGGGTPEPVVHFSTGVDEFVETVRVLTGDRPVNLRPLRQYGCNYHFLVLRPGTVRKITGLEHILAMDSVLDAEIFVKEGSVIPPLQYGTQRSGFVITGAPSREEAYRLGTEAETLIHVEYE